MGFLFKNRRQKLVDIYQKYYKGESPSDIDEIFNEHPKLELYEAALINSYLEYSKTPKEFSEALKKLEIK